MNLNIMGLTDPLMGEWRCTESDLKKRYDFTGFYLVISKE